MNSIFFQTEIKPLLLFTWRRGTLTLAGDLESTRGLLVLRQTMKATEGRLTHTTNQHIFCSWLKTKQIKCAITKAQTLIYTVSKNVYKLLLVQKSINVKIFRRV